MLSAIASLAVLAAMAVAGIAVIGRIFRFTTELERLAYGSVVGITAATLLLVPVAPAVGLTPMLVVAVAIGAIAVAFVAGWPALSAARRQPPSMRAAIARLDPIATIVIGLLTVRWALLWRDALELRPDGLWAGHEYIWSDWPTHLALVTRFAWGGGDFPPQNVHMAGLPLAYHYLSDLTPAAFVVLGMDPFGALELHSFVLSVLAALAVWAFARRMTGRRSAATLGTVLFLVGAGLGWMAHLANLDLGQGPVAALIGDPWDPKTQVAAHVRVFNPYIAFLMSQRAYLYGLPIAMLVLSAVGIAAPRRSIGLFVAAGVVAGLLPLAHLPTLLAMAIVIPIVALALLDRPWRIGGLPIRGWLAFGLAWVVVSVPQLLTQLGGGSGALSATRIQLGWVAGEGDFTDTWLSFWLLNAGLLGILCAIAIAIAIIDRHRRPGDRLLPPRGLRMMLALQVIFVVVNVVVFQPWDWDNHKILVYWMLSAAILSAALLVAMWRRARRWSWAGRGLARVGLAGLVVAIVAGPILENAWMLGGGGRYRMLTTEQLDLAARVREVAPAGSVVVTGMGSHDPVQMLSGRQVLMGYWGQLWVSGIPHGEREAEVLRIYRLAPDAADLIERYGVSAVVVGPDERSGLGADEAGYLVQYPVIATSGPYRVFATDKSVRQSGG
jgi:hypothetical protein